MPTAALRMCGKAGCFNLVGNGRVCPIHPPRKAWRTSTTSRQARGYGADHDRIRAQIAKEEAACACGDTGPWVADHEVALSEGGTTTRENMARTCLKCSKAKTAREAQRALRRAKARYGFDMDAGRES
jgi:5-methylcytosine-specific restriction protein A